MCDKDVIRRENNSIKMTICKRKNIRDERLESKRIETKILNVSKRILVRLRHNMFGF